MEILDKLKDDEEDELFETVKSIAASNMMDQHKK